MLGQKGMSTVTLALSIIHLVICAALIIVVLTQSGKTSGLAGAIGGGSDTYLSKNKSKSFDARLARITKWFAAAFAITTLLLHML